MELKFKKLSEKAVLPTRSYKGDAGLDFTCTEITTAVNEARQLMLVYHTGLAVEIPEGYVGLLFPRSSIWKKSIAQTNCVGVIDSGYRGEIIVTMRPTTDTIPAVFQAGERFAQLIVVPIPYIEPVEVEELSESERGDKGFGSSDESSAPTALHQSESVDEAKVDEQSAETVAPAPEAAAEPTIGSEQA